MQTETVRGFSIRLDRAYDLNHHMWVEILSPDRVRIGMDPLGLETSGTLAQLGFLEPGTELSAGDQLGSLEAEKFVGPLIVPVSGTVIAVNDLAMTDPSIVERDPFEQGWMIELAPSALEADLSVLVQDPEAIVAGFERKVQEYRRDGVLAE